MHRKRLAKLMASLAIFLLSAGLTVVALHKGWDGGIWANGYFVLSLAIISVVSFFFTVFLLAFALIDSMNER